MTFGILCILAGILIAIYPQILVAIISGFLMAIGVVILLIRFRLRRMQRQDDSPFTSFFLRW